MTTPTPAAPPATATVAVAATPPGAVTKAVHWLELHVLPDLKEADSYAERLISEAQKIEAVIEAGDPAIGTQLSASAAVLRDIAEALKAL